MSTELSQFFINLDLDTSERLPMSRFMEFLGDNYDPLTSYVMNNLKSLPSESYADVAGEVGRPDTLSYRIYGTTEYWWLLMFYNSISSIEEIQTGLRLFYPSMESIEELLYSLKSKQGE